MTKDLLHAFESITGEYLQLIAAFSQEQINTVPFEGSWTAAQVTEHLFKSDNAMLKTLYGPVQPTHRLPDNQVEQLEKIFLDFTTQLTAPDFIIPANITHDKETLISAFKSVRELIGKAIETLDLSLTCQATILGELTRLEIIHFIIFHTQRHTRQLKNIFDKVVNKQMA